MKKTFPAVLAALLITVCLAGGMFAVGGGSFMNSASAAPAATPAVAVDQTLPSDSSQAALIAEYQAREVQYQAQINDAVNRITTANQQVELASQQIQQYQSLMAELQNSGLITVGSDGTVTINQQQQQGFSPFGGDNHNGEHH